MTPAELLRPLSVAECRDHIYATLAARGAVTSSWKPGAVVRTIIYALAIMAAAFSALQVKIAQSAFLGTASGAWLTMVARYTYGVERLEGSFATGNLVLTNSGGGIYSGDPDDLIFRGANDKEYRNTEPFSLGSGASITIPVRAVEIGTASDAPAGTITHLVTPMPGVTATNPLALAGTDPETDEQLRARCVDALGALSPNGPPDAYRYAATSARRADGTPIGVTRVETIPDGYGNVDVYVATPTGAVSGDAGDPDTDLGAVAAAIKTQAEPIAVTAIVESATPEPISVVAEVWVRRASQTNTQIEEQIEAFLMDWISTLRIGGQRIPPSTQGYVYQSAVEAAIAQALDAPPVRVTVSSPASDVALAVNEAAALSGVTVTVHQIAEGA